MSQPMRRILIADDHDIVRRGLKNTLEEELGRMTFGEAENGRQVLEQVRQQAWDLVLLDIGLPDMTGWKIIDAIRNEEEARRPLVVVITAHGDPANRLMGKLQGVYTYLIKPFTPSEVERVVGNALASRFSGEATTEETVVPSADSSARTDQPESSDAPQRDRDGAVSHP
jgi:CheY-like chemotaxis protein